MSDIDKLLKIKEKIADAKEGKARAEGKLEELMKGLKKDFGVTSIEEAKKLLTKLTKDADKLKENLEALLVALKKAKPTQAKGVYIKKVSISTTMGAGVAVDQAGLSAAAN